MPAGSPRTFPSLNGCLRTFSADVEEDGLLIMVLELGICAVSEQQLDEFRGELVSVGEGSEVKRRLSELRLELIDQKGGGIAEDGLNFLRRAV